MQASKALCLEPVVCCILASTMRMQTGCQWMLATLQRLLLLAAGSQWLYHPTVTHHLSPNIGPLWAFCQRKQTSPAAPTSTDAHSDTG